MSVYLKAHFISDNWRASYDKQFALILNNKRGIQNSFHFLLLFLFFSQQALDLAVREFQDNTDLMAQAGGSARSIQWNGLRYMLTEV